MYHNLVTEYQKTINLLDNNNTLTQPYKFRKKNWVEINDDFHETYSTNFQSKFNILILN